MGKIIVGIHGLNNKPEKEIYTEWWLQAIKEGLRINCGVKSPDIEFELAYWRDLRYSRPYHFDQENQDELFSKEPYVAAKPGTIKTYEDSMLDTIREYGLHLPGSMVDVFLKYFGKDSGNELLKDRYPDLYDYYNGKETRQKIRNRLKGILLKHRSNADIMLISHSMGSIIAYDVLCHLASDDANYKINHFVTMGSPLGFPLIKYNIYEEFGRITTPEAVAKNWYNFSDRRDQVCFDEHLKNDFKENSKNIRVKDDLVFNDYPLPEDAPNCHKIFGYLRTPEFSKMAAEFLT